MKSVSWCVFADYGIDFKVYIHKLFPRAGSEESHILNEKVDIQVVKDAAFQPLKEKWAAEIWNEPKPRTYSLTENEFGVENYVKYTLCAQFKSGMLSIFKHDTV